MGLGDRRFAVATLIVLFVIFILTAGLTYARISDIYSDTYKEEILKNIFHTKELDFIKINGESTRLSLLPDKNG